MATISQKLPADYSRGIAKVTGQLGTGYVQNVVTTWRGWLGWPRLGTDAEVFFPGTGHTYPHLDEVHDMG
jgi:hypothetical protein